jgi:hypothetical protein
MKLRGLITAFLSVSAVLLSAQAGVSLRDVQVLGRVMGFLDHKPPANVKLGIVYDPASPASQKDASDMLAQMGASYKAGDFTLSPSLVKIGDVGSVGVDAFFLVSGVSGAAKLADITNSKKIPCFTSEINYVKSGACIIGVKSDPTVVIMVNSPLSKSSGITFGAAFRMMITEI